MDFVGTMASLGDGVDGLAWHFEGPGIQGRTSFTDSPFELGWASNGKADAEFSCLTVRLFSSVDEGVERYFFWADRKADDFSGDSRDFSDWGGVLWSVDEEGVIRWAGVLLPDNEIDDDCLVVDFENFWEKRNDRLRISFLHAASGWQKRGGHFFGAITEERLVSSFFGKWGRGNVWLAAGKGEMLVII